LVVEGVVAGSGDGSGVVVVGEFFTGEVEGGGAGVVADELVAVGVVDVRGSAGGGGVGGEVVFRVPGQGVVAGGQTAREGVAGRVVGVGGGGGAGAGGGCGGDGAGLRAACGGVGVGGVRVAAGGAGQGMLGLGGAQAGGVVGPGFPVGGGAADGGGGRSVGAVVGGGPGLGEFTRG
jgi:hypothetical protein